MTNRNRRNHAKGGGMMMMRGVAIGAAVLGLVLAYIGVSNSCDNLGRQIKQAEQEKAELLKQVMTEEQNWAQARSIRNMEALMAQYRLEMGWPAEKDIIRLHVSRPESGVVEYARAR